MKHIYLTLLFSSFLFSSDFSNIEAEMQKMKDQFSKMKMQNENDFAQMKMKNQNEFTSYKKNLEAEFSAYQKEIAQDWREPKLSTKMNWVSYSDDKQSRSNLDFENNYLVIETIAENEQEAKKQLEKRLSYAVSKNTQEVVATDPLQKRISKVSKKENIKTSKIDKKPILSNILFKKPPTKTEVKNYSKTVLKKTPIKVTASKKENKKVYKIKVPLPRNATLKRANVYKEEVYKNAQRFNLPKSLIFAVMQTESNFNPFARSHIPAFGLMQIVPTSAGRDVYKFLYKKKGMPSAEYLYNGKNNIEMGSTYLHILYFRYLKKIKNPQTRMYCSIAAYNTGAGNIAWAFTGKNNVSKASVLINKMSPEEVYTHLLKNLKYDEPKHYLQRVRKRMGSFEQAYNL